MKKASKKKNTMDDLAGMVQRGFAETAKKVDLDRVENNLRILSENNTRDHEDIKLRLDKRKKL